MSYRDLKPSKNNYYREIPCEGNIYYIYSLIDLEGINDSLDTRSDFSSMGIQLIKSIFLNWIYKNIISLNDNGKMFIINEELKFENDLDLQLMKIIKDISEDNILEKNELIKIDNNNS